MTTSLGFGKLIDTRTELEGDSIQKLHTKQKT